MRYFLEHLKALRNGEMENVQGIGVEEQISAGRSYGIFAGVSGAIVDKDVDTLSMSLRWDGAPANFKIETDIQTSFGADKVKVTVNPMLDTNAIFIAFEPLGEFLFPKKEFDLFYLKFRIEEVMGEDKIIVRLRITELTD